MFKLNYIKLILIILKGNTEALDMIKKLRKNGGKLKVENYTRLISEFTRSGFPDQAEKLINIFIFIFIFIFIDLI